MSNAQMNIQKKTIRQMREEMKLGTVAEVKKIEKKQKSFVYDPPPPAPKVPDSLITSLIEKVPSFTPSNSLLVPGSKALIKHNYPTTSIGVDNLAIQAITVSKSYTKEYLDDVILPRIQRTITTNNTLTAALTNIIAKTPRAKPEIDKTRYVDYIPTILPCGNVSELLVEAFTKDSVPNFDDDEIFDFVETADAGMPYMAKDKGAKCNADYLALALQKAELLITLLKDPNAMKDGSPFKQYWSTNALDFTFMLKRKFERMDREKFNQKVRAYYVTPFHLKILFKWVAYYVLKSFPNFYETKGQKIQSSSFYRFSWNDGGARELHEFIFKNRELSKKSDKVIFHHGCFGDDNIYVFTYPSGHIVIWNPDFEGMDFNVPQTTGAFIAVSFYRANPSFFQNHLFRNVFALLNIVAFQHNVLVGGSHFVFKRWSLISGIPMTTFYNIFASGMASLDAISVVKSLNVVAATKVFVAEKFHMVQQKITDNIARNMKMKIKPSTMGFQIVEPSSTIDQFELTLPFLGCVTKQTPVGPVPVPSDAPKVFTTLALPTTLLKKTGTLTAADQLYSRALGAYYCGSCFGPASLLIQELCADLKEKGAIPKYLLIDSTFASDEDVKSLIELSPLPPTVSQMELFYTNKAKFIESMLKAPPEKSGNAPAVHKPGESVMPSIQDDDEAAFIASLISEPILENQVIPVSTMTPAELGVKSIKGSQAGQRLMPPDKKIRQKEIEKAKLRREQLSRFARVISSGKKGSDKELNQLRIEALQFLEEVGTTDSKEDSHEELTELERLAEEYQQVLDSDRVRVTREEDSDEEDNEYAFDSLGDLIDPATFGEDFAVR